MEKNLSVLKCCPLFAGISDREILKILHCMDAEVKHICKDEYILRAGDTTEAVWLLAEGSALIAQEDLWGNRNIMANLTSGDFFAEPFAIIPDAVLNVSVIAIQDCKAVKIPADRLLTICSNACQYHNRLIQNLITVLAKKTLLINDKITHMSKRKTRDKLLSYLSAESKRQGSLSFDIPFDRQQLADFLCVERAAMSVELSRLQKEGILETDHSHFELNLDNADE